jgi:hypothetical protein
MNKKGLFIVLLSFGMMFFGIVREAQAQNTYVVGRSLVTYDVQAGTVGGMSGTYLGYNLDYYNPWVQAELYYYDPYDFLDYDHQEGMDNTSYLGFPGVTVEYETNEYKPSQYLCVFSDHRVRALYQNTALRYYDPYNLGATNPQVYYGEFLLENYLPPGTDEEYYRDLPLYQMGYIWICILTPTVDSVNFETINSPVTTNNPGFAGGGSRIFPDRDHPGDTANKQIVRVKAQIVPALQGIPVYFNNYDVDDPSSDPVIDPDSGGYDNYGSPLGGVLSGGSTACQSSNGFYCRLTDANGEATINLTVTMQPGDNFRVAASTDSSYLSGVAVSGTGLQDSMGRSLETSAWRARQSVLLTVWRRLHIEVDSMGPAQQNFIAGTIPGKWKLNPGDIATITLNPSPSADLEPNRFEGGRLVVGDVSLPVTCNIANNVNCNTEFAVRVQNTGSTSVSIPSNSQFQLYDDDDFNNNDGANVDGDTRPLPGEDIPMPNICLIQGANMPTWSNCSTQGNPDDPNTNILAPAYIHPVYDIGDNNEYTVFSANVSANTGPAIRDLFDFDQIATEASTDFWTAYLLGGYQHTIDADDDPESGDGAGQVGVTDAQNGVGSIIFMETNGPKECTLSPIFCNIAATTAHELGHLLNAFEGDGGIMDDESLSFSPTSLAKIRAIPNP